MLRCMENLQSDFPFLPITDDECEMPESGESAEVLRVLHDEGFCFGQTISPDWASDH